MKKYLLASFAVLLFFGFSHVAHADITTGLVANWKLDEGSGTTAADSVGGFTGTLVNGTTWTAGKIGSSAAAFAGSPVQYISTTYAGQLTDFTVCAWFNPSSNSSYRRIVDKNSQTGFWLGENPSGQWGGGIEQASSPYGTYVTIPNALGNWHHLCMTRSGTTQTVYADGGAESANGTVSSAALDSTKFYIGAASTASNAFAGSIDDVRIYNRALSAADVSELYSYTGVTATADYASNLLVYYPMEDSASDTTVADASGNGHNGTMSAPTSGYSTTGKIGQGFAFNGASASLDTNYIWSANDPSFTVAAWFNTTGVSQIIFSSYNGQPAMIAANLDNGGRPECQVYSSNSEYASTLYNKIVNDGAWHHIACVMSGTTLTLYFDGVSVNSTTDPNLTGNYSGRSPRTIQVGPGFTGTLDEARIYNRALSATDIAGLYGFTGSGARTKRGGGSSNAGASGVTSALSGWAWSSNVGWVSFNSYDSGTGPNGSGTSSVPYEVDISTSTGSTAATFSGYAWSPNVGWVSFQPGDASGCGSAATGVVDANGNFTGQISGYVRVISELNRDDGWDGCVYLGDNSGTPTTNYQYSPTDDSNPSNLFTYPSDPNNYKYLKGGVTYSTADKFFRGFAWSGNVLGWLTFESPFPSKSVSITCPDGCPPGGSNGPDFSITGNLISLPPTGSVDTTMTISNVSTYQADQSIAEALSNLPSGVSASITDVPATCSLTSSNVSCTVHIHVVSSSASPGTYTAILTGTRAANGTVAAATHTGSLAITIEEPTESPVHLYIGSSLDDINGVPDSQKPTLLRIKKGNPFALEWKIDLDPSYSCTSLVAGGGTWSDWTGTTNQDNINGSVNGTEQTGSVSFDSQVTSDNSASVYTFSISCGNSDGQLAPASATLILQSSSESEI